MRLNGNRRLAALTASAVLLLSACAPGQNTPAAQPDGNALTWSAWTGYDGFLNLAARTCPDIKLEPTAYAGANRTGCSWAVSSNFAELETLCAEIEEAGLIPGVLATELTGHTFSAVFNLAKTSWLTTPEGMGWERDFLDGRATAAGMWEGTMDYIRQYIDIGMFRTGPGYGRAKKFQAWDCGGGKAVVECRSS